MSGDSDIEDTGPDPPNAGGSNTSLPILEATPGAEPGDDPETADPFDTNLLALNFDYLLYKITDLIETLSKTTQEAVQQQQQRFTSLDLPGVEASIASLERLMPQLLALEAHLMALNEVSTIATLFRARVGAVEQSLRTHRSRRGRN